MNAEKIDRDKLKLAICEGGPLAAIRLAIRLGYRRRGFSIVHGNDWVEMPSYSLRQSDAVLKLWKRLPEAK